MLICRRIIILLVLYRIETKGLLSVVAGNFNQIEEFRTVNKLQAVKKFKIIPGRKHHEGKFRPNIMNECVTLKFIKPDR